MIIDFWFSSHYLIRICWLLWTTKSYWMCNIMGKLILHVFHLNFHCAFNPKFGLSFIIFKFLTFLYMHRCANVTSEWKHAYEFITLSLCGALLIFFFFFFQCAFAWWSSRLSFSPYAVIVLLFSWSIHDSKPWSTQIEDTCTFR